jgi:hypothetical protein
VSTHCGSSQNKVRRQVAIAVIQSYLVTSYHWTTIVPYHHLYSAIIIMQHHVSAYNYELQYLKYKAIIYNYMININNILIFKAGMLIAYM